MRYLVNYEIMPQVFSEQAVDRIVMRQTNIEADPAGDILAQIYQELSKTEYMAYVTDYTLDDEDDILIIADYFD